MISRTRRGVLVTVATVAGLLFAAPQALAGTVTFEFPEDPGYINTTGSNTQNVAAEYQGCLTTQSSQFAIFALRSTVQTTTTATFYVVRDEGQEPLATLRPTNPITLTAGPEQRQRVRLVFALDNPSTRPATFRVGLRTESGESLGDPVGIEVTVPCVVEAQRRLPATTSRAAQARARCLTVATSRRQRVGQRSRLTIQVRTRSGVPVIGSRVRISERGARSVNLFTENEGIINVVGTPERVGELVIQSDVCGGSVRIPVAAARTTRGRGSPNFTG